MNMKSQTIKVDYIVKGITYSVCEVILGHENLSKDDLLYTAKKIAQKDLQKRNCCSSSDLIRILNYVLL